MPLVLKELATSRSLSEGRREGNLELQLEVLYKIEGSDDPANKNVRKLGPQPATAYGDPSLNLFVINRKYKVLRATGATGVIELTVVYGPPERLPSPEDPNAPDFEISILGETVKIERALAQRHYPASADEVNKFIGVNGEKVDGVDVYFPKTVYTHNARRSKVDSRFIRLIDTLAFHVNNAAWKYWSAGEVLFEGCKIRRKGYGEYQMQYNFVIQRNTSQNISTLAGNQQFTKLGWEYQWFTRVQQKDGTKLKQGTESVHVATVYPVADFSQLGI